MKQLTYILQLFFAISTLVIPLGAYSRINFASELANYQYCQQAAGMDCLTAGCTRFDPAVGGSNGLLLPPGHACVPQERPQVCSPPLTMYARNTQFNIGLMGSVIVTPKSTLPQIIIGSFSPYAFTIPQSTTNTRSSNTASDADLIIKNNSSSNITAILQWSRAPWANPIDAGSGGALSPLNLYSGGAGGEGYVSVFVSKNSLRAANLLPLIFYPHFSLFSELRIGPGEYKLSAVLMQHNKCRHPAFKDGDARAREIELLDFKKQWAALHPGTTPPAMPDRAIPYCEPNDSNILTNVAEFRLGVKCADGTNWRANKNTPYVDPSFDPDGYFCRGVLEVDPTNIPFRWGTPPPRFPYP